MSTLLEASLSRPAPTAWSNALRDVLRGAATVGRAVIALAGFAVLSASFALLVSEQARDRALSAALSVVGAETEAQAAEAAPIARAEPQPSTWSTWLAGAPGGRLEPQQEHVTRYLSRRYRVAEGAVRQIVSAAFSTGRSLGMDPLLILAVTAVESSLNPFAQSSVGAQGLMQVMTRVHSEKFVSHGGDHAALDPIANLKVGSDILSDLIRRGGSVERGLQLYVGAGNLPDDGGYAARVMGELARIKTAANGNVGAALSAGWRADSRAGTKPAETAPSTADAEKATPAAT